MVSNILTVKLSFKFLIVLLVPMAPKVLTILKVRIVLAIPTILKIRKFFSLSNDSLPEVLKEVLN